MKKIILIATLLIASLSQAQAITVFNQGEQIVNNGVYTYSTLGPSSKLHLLVTNVSDATMNLKLKMVAIENGTGNGVQFCFGEFCYLNAPVGTAAPDNLKGITLDTNESNSTSDYFYNESPGTIEGQPVKYKIAIVQLDDAGEQIGDALITFDYVYDTTAGVNDFASLENMGITVKNTMVTGQLEIVTQQNAKMEIYNINGQSVKSASINNGSHSIDLSGLSSAVYIAKFTNEENKTSQIRIVKK